MADIKLTALPLAGTVTSGDILYLVTNPGSTPASKKITVSQLMAMITAGGALHAPTHGFGGADPITTLNAGVAISGGFPSLKLNGTTDNPGIEFNCQAAAAGLKQWRIFTYTDGRLFFRASGDDGSGGLDPLTISHAGAVTVNGTTLIVGSAGAILDLHQSSGTVNARRWRIHNYTDGNLYVQPAPDSGLPATSSLTINRNGNLTVGGEILKVLAPRAGLHLLDTAATVDKGLWRIVSGDQNLYLLATNNALTANDCNITIQRDGRINTSHLSLSGTLYVGGGSTLSGTISCNAISCSTINTNGNTITSGPISAAGTLYVSGGSTLVGTVTCNAITCTSINTQNNGIVCGPLSASGRVVLAGGVTGAYNQAPLEIAMTGYPRIGFHWPGVIASQLGMDSAGTIRTFDNPGTGYAAFTCGTFYVSGNSTLAGALTTNGITCTNINTQGNNVTTGTLNVSGNTWGSNVYASGTVTAATATIGAVGFNTGGYPAFRAQASAHLVINGSPLYLNLDIPGNVIYVQGPLSCAYSISIPNGEYTAPSFNFNSYPNSGIYANPTNPTIEFGSNFHATNRAALRTWLDRARVDLYCGTSAMLAADNTRGVFCGVDTGFYLGDSTGRWHTLFALTGTINTSDVRLKDVHGDLQNVLPFVEAIQPIIGSFKEELRPETMKDNPNWGEHFPTFSAQDIQNRIDRELGTRIVDDTNPDQLGMNYSRLVPVLWQAVRELLARVKALEP